MFLGHYGVAFAAKKIAPRVSLPVLFVAAQFADILWPVFLVSNIEKYAVVPGVSVVSAYDFIYYPWSHSLLMEIIWGLLFGLVYYFFTKNRRGAITVGFVVLSHWILDLLLHIPDLPLAPFSGIKWGLGGWNSIPFTIAAECFFFFGGLLVYIRNTKPVRVAGRWVLAVLVVLLTVLYFSTTFFSNSSSEGGSLMLMFIIFMILQAILVWLAQWTDKSRVPKASSPL